MEMTVREAQPKDSADIVQLIQEHASGTGESSRLNAAYVAQYLASPMSTILIAEAEQRMVGLLSWSVRPDLYHAGDACLVEELVVRAGWRDQGIGGALLEELLARAAELCYAEVSVAVMQDNGRAIEFYRSHGLRDEALLLEMHFPGLKQGSNDRAARSSTA